VSTAHLKLGIWLLNAMAYCTIPNLQHLQLVLV